MMRRDQRLKRYYALQLLQSSMDWYFIQTWKMLQAFLYENYLIVSFCYYITYLYFLDPLDIYKVYHQAVDLICVFFPDFILFVISFNARSLVFCFIMLVCYRKVLPQDTFIKPWVHLSRCFCCQVSNLFLSAFTQYFTRSKMHSLLLLKKIENIFSNM